MRIVIFILFLCFCTFIYLEFFGRFHFDNDKQTFSLIGGLSIIIYSLLSLYLGHITTFSGGYRHIHVDYETNPISFILSVLIYLVIGTTFVLIGLGIITGENIEQIMPERS